MAEEIIYFAIVRGNETVERPSGLARRTFTPQGRLDETLSRDLTWKRDSVIYEWERGEEMGAEVVEISEAEAKQLIERFRQGWGQEY